MKCIEANINITVIEGGTFDKTYQWKTGELPVPVDLLSFTAHMQIRAKLKDTESKIESTVYQRGIRLQVEFATFKNKHIEALYGGVSASQLKKVRNIPSGRSLADFDTHVELKAKDFALAMTDHNIKDKNIRGKEAMNNEVVTNSKATRETLLSRGIRPEHLKPEEDLKQVESRRKKERTKGIKERRG